MNRGGFYKHKGPTDPGERAIDTADSTAIRGLWTRGEGDRYCGFYLPAFEVWIEPIFGRGLYHLKVIDGLFPAPQPNEAGALAASKGLDPGGCSSKFINSKNGCDRLRLDRPAANPPVRQAPFLALGSCLGAVLAVVKTTTRNAKQSGHS